MNLIVTNPNGSRPMLDRFKVLLLDLNGTFMFGEDRFGPDEDFAATYRSLGGTELADDEVEQLVRLTYDSMAADYENPARHDDFPQVADTLRNCAPALANVELNRIEEVIAIHELGRIPDAYAAHLRQLGQTHRLGLVANIWSRKALWLRELERAGVLDLLEYPVFSSDCRSMKPSPVLFNLAFEPFGVRREEVVFIGDSLVNDIAGARRAGFATVWINPAGSPSDQPDWTVPSLLDCCPFGRGS